MAETRDSFFEPQSRVMSDPWTSPRNEGGGTSKTHDVESLLSAWRVHCGFVRLGTHSFIHCVNDSWPIVGATMNSTVDTFEFKFHEWLKVSFWGVKGVSGKIRSEMMYRGSVTRHKATVRDPVLHWRRGGIALTSSRHASPAKAKSTITLESPSAMRDGKAFIKASKISMVMSDGAIVAEKKKRNHECRIKKAFAETKKAWNRLSVSSGSTTGFHFDMIVLKE